MTKKHFRSLAYELHRTMPANDAPADMRQLWGHTVQAVAKACAIHNSAFSAARFIEACMTGEG